MQRSMGNGDPSNNGQIYITPVSFSEIITMEGKEEYKS